MVPTVLTTSRLFRALGRALVAPATRSIVALAILIVISGTAFYSQVEGWSVVDSLYFCVVTLTTIGFGDIAPVTTAGKLFTIAYSLLGVGVLASFVAAIALAERADWTERSERRQHTRRAKRDEDQLPNEE